MAAWHSIEVFCPTCQTWQDSSVGTAAEDLNGDEHPTSRTGKVAPPCGHGVPAGEYKTRLGPVIGAPLEPAPEDEGSHDLHDDDGPNPELDPSV